MLTGDQIYADDLGAGMLVMVNAIADAIIDGDEMIRVDGTQFPVVLENFPAERRLKFVQETAGFTTTDGDNHLLSFGEFAAMYLASWNPRIWVPLGTPDKVFVPFAGDERLRALLSYPEGKFAEADAFKEITGPDGKPQKIFGMPGTNQTHVNQARQKWLEDRTKEHGGFTNEQTNTVIFRHGVPRIARVARQRRDVHECDDHEVTDDWNLNQKWRNRVYSTTAGKDIIRNAVAAYGVFQGWGNDPVKFETGNNKDFLDKTSAMFDDGADHFPSGPLDRIEELTGVLVVPKLDKQPVWHYQTVGPRHVIAVLDSRTRRKFTGQDYTPPDLIGNNRDEQIPKGPFTDEHELVFIVAPAPVFGPDVIESLGWPLAILLTDVKRRGAGAAGSGPVKKEAGTEKFDNEGWASNPQAREDFLKRLTTFPRAVILSGDVHYGCSMAIDYWKKGTATPVRIAQLTSSGTRNNFKPIVASIVRTNAMLQLFLSDLSAEQLAWTATPPDQHSHRRVRVAGPIGATGSLSGVGARGRLAKRDNAARDRRTGLVVARGDDPRHASRHRASNGAAAAQPLAVAGARGDGGASDVPSDRRTPRASCRDELRSPATDRVRAERRFREALEERHGAHGDAHAVHRRNARRDCWFREHCSRHLTGAVDRAGANDQDTQCLTSRRKRKESSAESNSGSKTRPIGSRNTWVIRVSAERFARICV